MQVYELFDLSKEVVVGCVELLYNVKMIVVTNDNSIVDLTALGIYRMDTLLESDDPIERISKLSDKNLTK